MFNMKDRAKWDAWKAVEGKHFTLGCSQVYFFANQHFSMIRVFILSLTRHCFGLMSAKSTEEAMSDYITKVKQLLEAAAST